MLFLLTSQKNWYLFIEKHTCTHRVVVSWDSLGTVSVRCHSPAWENTAVTPAILSQTLGSSSALTRSLSACIQFPLVSVLGVWGVVAQAINQVRPWWYLTAPFQHSRVLFSGLVQGPYQGSSHSVLVYVVLSATVWSLSSWSRQGCNFLVIITVIYQYLSLLCRAY